jgi:hypothetical protein
MKNLLKLTLFISFLHTLSFADQYSWISKDIAKKAENILKEQKYILEFCEPCKDTTCLLLNVDDIAIMQVDKDDYQISVNGYAIDLAYVFISKDGSFKNLASYLKLETEDVSTMLEKSTLPKNYLKALKIYLRECNMGKKECEQFEQAIVYDPKIHKLLKSTIEAKKLAESQYQPSNYSNSGHPGEMCEQNGGSWTWNGNVNQWMCYQNNQQANSSNSNYQKQQQQAYQQEQLRIQQEQLAIQRQQLEMQQEQNRQRNVNGVLNSINGLNQTIGNMNNQMQQRNNNFNGFDASKGLNFNRY